MYHQKALHRWPDIKIHEICITFLCVISRRPTFLCIPFRQANRGATRNTRILKRAYEILGRASPGAASRIVCLLWLLFDFPMRTLRSKLLLGKKYPTHSPTPFLRLRSLSESSNARAEDMSTTLGREYVRADEVSTTLGRGYVRAEDVATTLGREYVRADDLSTTPGQPRSQASQARQASQVNPSKPEGGGAR